MQLLDFVNNSFQPGVKLMICAVILFALLIGYYWEPRRRKETVKKDTKLQQDHVTIETKKLNRKTRTLFLPTIITKRSASSPVLQQLDDYAKTIKSEIEQEKQATKVKHSW